MIFLYNILKEFQKHEKYSKLGNVLVYLTSFHYTWCGMSN